MNRGQAPQRPPNLAPSQNMGNAFRSPYAIGGGYPMAAPPSRSVAVGGAVGGVGVGVGVGVSMLGYPAVGSVPNHSHSHRTQAQQQQQQTQSQQQQPTTPSIMGGPSAGLFSQRGGFPFGMQQQQQHQHPNSTTTASSQTGSSTTVPVHLQHHQHQQQPTLSQQHQQQQQQQQQQPPQPPQPAPTPSVIGSSAPSVSGGTSSNGGDLGLGPNDFPALGAVGAGANGTSHGHGGTTAVGAGTTGAGVTTNGTSSQTPAHTPALSYATQAGAGVAMGGLGIPLSSVIIGSGVPHSGPSRDFGPDDFPALGQQSSSSQQQQQSSTTASGATDGVGHGINGFLEGSRTSGLQSRTTTGFPGESESRKFSLKSAPPQSSNPSWTTTNVSNSASQQQQQQPFPSTLTNGTSSNHPPLTGGPPTIASAFPNSQLGNNNNQSSGTTFPDPANPGASALSQPNANNGNSNGASGLPQTPAQQVLMSAADRWGLLGLLSLIRSPDQEVTMLSIGTDLGTMGMDMTALSSLYPTFITPWSDSSAAHLVEPDFHLPQCYNVAPGPITGNKAQAFSDETLFFMFYAHPRDILQEIAAQELWTRNWRFHKTLGIWLTKETGTSPSQKQMGGETGLFMVWDPDSWEKTRKRMWVSYSDLEEKQPQSLSTGPATTTGTTGTGGANTATPAVGTTNAVVAGGQAGVPTQQQAQQQQQQPREQQTITGGGASGAGQGAPAIPVSRFGGMALGVGA